MATTVFLLFCWIAFCLVVAWLVLQVEISAAATPNVEGRLEPEEKQRTDRNAA
jgi:hypothetical protein